MITDAMRASIARVEQDYRTTVVAIAIGTDGAIVDHCFTWETAQNYALSEGVPILAIADDGHMSRDDIQRLCDADLARYRDCFSTDDM